MVGGGEDRGKLLRVGDVLEDRYRIEGGIGEGAFGKVFRAVDQEGGGAAAVKAIPPTISERSETALGRFRREMKVIRNLEHPNIIALYDWGRTEQGVIYMILEFVDGQTLEEVVRHNPMDQEVARQTARQLAGGVDAAHEAGVIHRDLKPANVMLIPDDERGYRVKVLDFGMAKVLSPLGDESLHDLTREGVAVGTPRYIAPEQARGQQVGPTADLYAVGLLMYEMFTGVPAVKATTMEAAVAAHVSKTPLELDEFDLVPAQMQPILTRLLEKDRDRRFQSGAELMDALDDPKWYRQSILPDTSNVDVGPALGDVTGDFFGAGGLGTEESESDAEGTSMQVRADPGVLGGAEELELEDVEPLGSDVDGTAQGANGGRRAGAEEEERRRKRAMRDQWFRPPRTGAEWLEALFSATLIPLAVMMVGAQAAGWDPTPRLLLGLAPTVVALGWAISREGGEWSASFGRRCWICCLVAIAAAHAMGPGDLATELTRNPGWFLRPVEQWPGMDVVSAAVSWVSRQWASILFELVGAR